MSSWRDEKHTDAAKHALSSYNVLGGLGRIGKPILVHVIHEMNDGNDIQQLICSSGCMHDITSEKLFKWCIAPGLRMMYSLESVPVERTDMVCTLFRIFGGFML